VKNYELLYAQWKKVNEGSIRMKMKFNHLYSAAYTEFQNNRRAFETALVDWSPVEAVLKYGVSLAVMGGSAALFGPLAGLPLGSMGPGAVGLWHLFDTYIKLPQQKAAHEHNAIQYQEVGLDLEGIGSFANRMMVLSETNLKKVKEQQRTMESMTDSQIHNGFIDHFLASHGTLETYNRHHSLQ
jgi:hypothetical protein